MENIIEQLNKEKLVWVFVQYTKEMKFVLCAQKKDKKKEWFERVTELGTTDALLFEAKNKLKISNSARSFIKEWVKARSSNDLAAISDAKSKLSTQKFYRDLKKSEFYGYI